MPKNQAETLLQYRPSRECIELSQVIQQQLEIVERKVATSNHIPTIAAQRDMNVPLFKLLAQFTVVLQAEMANHVGQVAQYLASQIEPETVVGLPPDLGATIVDFLERTTAWTQTVQTVFDKAVAALKSEGVVEDGHAGLCNEIGETQSIGAKLKEEMAALAAAVDDATFDEGDEDEDEEEEDEEDEEDEDEEADEEDAEDMAADSSDEPYVPLLEGQAR